MEASTPPSSQPLNSRRAQQRQAVLNVLGQPAAVETKVEPTSLPPEVVPVVPEEAPKIEIIPEVGPEIEAAPVVLLKPVIPVVVSKPTPVALPQPVPAHRRIRRWPFVIVLIILVLPVAGWATLYYFGVDDVSVRFAASFLPLPAGRIGGQTVLLRDLYVEVDRQIKLAAVPLFSTTHPATAVDRRWAFFSLVDQQLIHNELQRRQLAVDASQVTTAMDRISRGVGSSSNLATWVYTSYNLDLPEFREFVVRPLLEGQTLAIALAADHTRYTQAWIQAEASSRLHGVVGMNDQGWLSATDLGPTVADAVASASRDTRTVPIVTANGLAVFLYTEKSTDPSDYLGAGSGVTFWHLWQELFFLDPVNDFLTQARLTADAAYWLP